MSAASATPDPANIASQSGSAGSPPVSGSSAPQARSYANATRTSASPPAVAVPQQHGNASTMSTSGSTAAGAPPVVGNAGPPNGAPSAPGDHGRKPSVTIGASGASGYIANGGPVPPSAPRRNINFGSMNSDGSPAVANSSPYSAQSSLTTPQSDPRISSPAASPTPIPQPPASGGRPPSGLQAQSNGLNFGSMGGSENDMSRSLHATPPGPSMPAQPVHLRRQSSQQSDMGTPGMSFPPQGPNRGQYMQGGGRGRGYPQGYQQQQMPYSPGPNYRPMPGQQRPGQGFPPQFQNQPGMPPFSGSPHPQSRSPMPQGSHPGTPHMQHQQMAPNQMQYQYQPSYHAYSQHLGPQAGQFGQQPGFDPNYQYYQSPYQMPPQYLGQGPPSSPRPLKQAPPTPHQQFVQGQFNQSNAPAMSRSPSHASTDRPASSIGAGPNQPPLSQTPSSAARSHTPSQSTGGAPSQSSNFTLPAKRATKGVVIKDANGNVITFGDNKGKSSPAPPTAKSASPANAPAAPTPPPPSSTPHNRTESKTNKTVEEIRAEFMQSVKKETSEDKLKEEDAPVTSTRDVDAAATAKADEDTAAAKVKADADAKAAEAKLEADEAAAALEKQQAEAKAAKEKEAEAKAAEEAAAKRQADAAAAEAAKTQQDAAAKAEADKAEADKAEADRAAPAAETPALTEDEEMERMIAEMEAKEKEDEERERTYSEKKRKDAEAKAKEDAAKNDEEMKRAEREAEAAEEAREQEKGEVDDESEEAKAEREQLFASLKKPTVGPGAEDASGTETPNSEDATPPAVQRAPSGAKPKPAALKLDIVKQVEPAQPTAGMQSLKSARMLQLQSESIKYPEGIKSPNPALINGTKRAGRVYNSDFLMQFQEVFKEKPSVDWEQKLKETIGDNSDSSAGPKSARTPMGTRASSGRGPPPPSAYQGMGTFGQGGRTLPPNTTSRDRFEASNSGRGPTMSNPLANFSSRPQGAFPMGNMPVNMSRQGSMQTMSHGQSPRNASQRGSAKSGRQDRAPSRKEQEQLNKSMPLTASGDVKALELSKSGWKPTSIGQQNTMASQPDPSGRLAPDMVQRKVKSNLNKMTPERFDKIADQILAIAGQSKDESDGRTLRQVIALTFEKACDEAHWASMYAKFCARMMETMTPEIKDENITDKHGNPVVGGALFRKYLLNRCQEEFEQGWEVNLPEQEEGKSEEAVMLSDEYYKAEAAKRKGLGLIQFIGELYKLQMLSTKIMNTCFYKLLNFSGMPDEAALESLVKLMRTVGATMDLDKDKQGSAYVSAYFERIEKIVAMPGLPSRMHFMLLDVIDLRKGGWRSKDDQKGPKTIQEIRAEAAAAQQQAELERQRQRTGGGGRIPSGRGDGRNYSGGMPPPNVISNQVATDELRRLQGRQSSRQASSGPSRPLGPTSMFSNRNGSGRQGLGPGGNLMNRTGDESGSSTRSASKRDDKSNTFSALAGLDQNETAEATPASSPQVTNATPATAVPAPDTANPADPTPSGGDKA